MITGALKNKIDQLWKIFWTGGITNPLDVIEQMTYLLFIRDLENAKDTPYKWSELRHLAPEKMYTTVQEQVFPYIKKLHNDTQSAYARYMEDAIFKIPTSRMLERIVEALDDIDEYVNNTPDTKGDVYEYLLSKLSTAGVNGQFRTPRHIIDMMVELMQPTLQDTIYDPACGTAGFLIASCTYLQNKLTPSKGNEAKEHFMKHMFHGFDTDRTMLRIAAMNMMLHGVENPDIQYKNSLTAQNDATDCCTLILANPPFKGSLEINSVPESLKRGCKTRKSELLFISLFLRMLKVGGRCACIVPDGVLFGTSGAHKAIRKGLIEEHRLQAVISMPSCVFKPYSGVSTSILIFTKTGNGGTDRVWFYNMKADGFSADVKRIPCNANDIPDIITRFRNIEAEGSRQRSDNSFFVEKEEIVANDYDLCIKKYKKEKIAPIAYPAPTEIMKEIRRLQKEIEKNLSEIDDLLS